MFGSYPYVNGCVKNLYIQVYMCVYVLLYNCYMCKHINRMKDVDIYWNTFI